MTDSVQVCMIEEARRLAAALAASDWPDREQSLKPYRPHRVATWAKDALAAYRRHPAVAAVTESVDSDGLPATLGLALETTSDLAAGLASFDREASLADLWSRTAPDWIQAEADLTAVLSRADLAGLLETAFGDLPRPLRLMPNLLYPGLQSVATVGPRGLAVLLPPPKAWGSSLPWRYSERPDDTLSAAGIAFAEALLPEALRRDGLAELAAKALAAILLRETEGLPAAESFVMLEKKSKGLARLPEAVRAVDAHLGESRAGQSSSLEQRIRNL